MSENRRVVVTGLGAITPLGNTVAQTWDAMKAGKNGIAPITLFDTENFKAKLGAEVKEFDPKEHLGVNEALRIRSLHPICVGCNARGGGRKRHCGYGSTGTFLPSFSVRVSVALAHLKKSIPN